MPPAIGCCKWMFPNRYRDMDEESGGGHVLGGGAFAAAAPPPRPKVVASKIGASTIGRSAESTAADDQVDEAERERRRQLAAERAEKRQDDHMSRGVGDVAKVQKMQDQNSKEELLGRITEQYSRLNEEMPMGLRLADVAQLKKHSADVQKRVAMMNAAAKGSGVT
eukprot:TRINITY_DN11499_c4_g1_i1.p1 TRINITY_DN11499_c4_g1~~TRINITY_DN11499_c4_g1_i1.p1  ORF type:complete len:166 (-),score=41.06 TRINITY_DN11499_c4_g1_i1:54-551(-)